MEQLKNKIVSNTIPKNSKLNITKAKTKTTTKVSLKIIQKQIKNKVKP